MPRIREPRHPLDKRDLLHKDPPDAKRIDTIGDQMLKDGRAAEAIDYIEVTRNPDLIARLLNAARETGSPFLLGQVERLFGETRPEEEWRAAAEKSLADGRAIDAVRALQHLGEEERAEELRLEHCPDYEPFRPLGK